MDETNINEAVLTDNTVNLFEKLDINSSQNNRFLIIGPSGTKKTHLLFNLILFVLPRYKRYLCIAGSNDVLKETVFPLVKKQGVEVFELNVTSSEDIKKVNFDTLGRGDLVIIDDITHLLDGKKNELSTLLIKAYTTSRHNNFDIITILHYDKMGNTKMRYNCTKIFLTGINNDIKQEYGQYIKNDKLRPIIFDCINGMKQQFLDLSSFNDLYGSSVLKRIQINTSASQPKFVRASDKPLFVQIDTGDEKFESKIPDSYFKLINGLDKYKDKYLTKKANPIIDDIVEDRQKVHEGQVKAGNDNTAIYTPRQPLETIKENTNYIIKRARSLNDRKILKY